MARITVRIEGRNLTDLATIQGEHGLNASNAIRFALAQTAKPLRRSDALFIDAEPS